MLTFAQQGDSLGSGHTTPIPAYVAFTNSGNRIFGDAALSQARFNQQNTIFDVMCLIGRKFDDKMKKELKKWPFLVVNVRGKPKIEVCVCMYISMCVSVCVCVLVNWFPQEIHCGLIQVDKADK